MINAREQEQMSVDSNIIEYSEDYYLLGVKHFVSQFMKHRSSMILCNSMVEILGTETYIEGITELRFKVKIMDSCILLPPLVCGAQT